MERADNSAAALSSITMDGSSRPYNLVGNYFPAEVKGEKFPASPPLVFQQKHVVENNICVSTNGKGRLFIPTSLIEELSEKNSVDDRYQILAAPGFPHPSSFTVRETTNRNDVAQECSSSYHSYYKTLIDAVKPIDDLVHESGKLNMFPGTTFFIYPTWDVIYTLTNQEINADMMLRRGLTGELNGNAVAATQSDVQETEQYLKAFQQKQLPGGKIVVCILDSSLQVAELTAQEHRKLKSYYRQGTDPAPNAELSHGTKVYKMIAATSVPETEIHFFKIGDDKVDADFLLAAYAFEKIIAFGATDDIILINCSFTCPANANAYELTGPGYFSNLHDVIHNMGFIVFGAAGNSTASLLPHEPWGSCSRCVVIGAHDTKDEVAEFSGGCCNPVISTFARGTDFSLVASQGKFSGTSYATAIVSGSFTFSLRSIWDVADYKQFEKNLKKYLLSGEKRRGCQSTVPFHRPNEWVKYVSPANTTNVGKKESVGSKVNLRHNGASSG